jgi:superfamily II DNA or RNA helicase
LHEEDLIGCPASLGSQPSTLNFFPLIPITERFLSECGGWQALREARSMHEAGRVLEARYAPPLLQGRVKTADSEVRAGLKISSASNVENLCTCREARREGRICAHSLAVGLEIAKPRPKPVAPVAAKAASAGVAPATASGPQFSLEQGIPVTVQVILPPDFPAAWEKGSVMVAFEAQVESRRAMLETLDASRTYRVDPHDLALVAKLSSLVGELPGVVSLPREAFLDLLGALRGRPRVSFGRDVPVMIAGQGTTLDAAPPTTARILSAGPHAWLLDGKTFTPIQSIRAAVAPPDAVSAVVLPDAFHLKLEGSLNHLTAELAVRYGDRVTTLAGRTVRNASAETAALDRLRASGFAGPDGRGQLVLKGEPKILAFFARELPRLEKEWQVEIGARFQHVTRDVERIAPRLEIRSSGENWFDLQFELGTADGERFSAAEIQRLLQSGQTSVRLKNRKVAVFDPALLDEFAEVLRDCEPQQRQPGLYRIDRRNAAYLAETAASQGLDVATDPAWTRLVGGQGAAPTPIPLGPLEDVLRPYQKQGVYWLKLLSVNGLAGILADEMGLGKTAQAIAFLRSVQGRSLVVCPASLVFNWQREVARFAPELRVAAIVGADRHEREPDANLLITSYPLLRRDAERYRDQEFAAVILDEAQHIKNPDTQNAQAAFALRARHRFALTGTPIENSVRDLWSLMHFLMPGYLGSREDFRDRYEREISSDPTGPAQKRLQRRLRPFVLRRLKRSVIAELPEKIEEVAYCELNGVQKRLYAELLQAARKQSEELAGAGHQGRARMLVLTALLRLRQVCCDPALLGQEPKTPAEVAPKVELLEELLAEAIDGGHRVLVFSQFVTMLRILQERLRASDVACCYLDGQTKDRAAQVDRFQAGDTPVFLISLKAGGTGLNLTAADTVIHFDPWWNPAVEAQATDRAHRIGQEKVVTSYKLIARGTVEEKILALQTRKRAMLDASLESEQPLMEELTLDDIRELLE